jgi:hypothetical protein
VEERVLRLAAIVSTLGLVGGVVSLLADPMPAGAVTQSFTSAGCATWTVPAGVTSVQIQAVGAAGGAGATTGGTGDGVSATVSGLTPGQLLDVCVDSGGGPSSGSSGSGGGASGVSVGSTFSAPVLVAGAGGGGSGPPRLPLAPVGQPGSPPALPERVVVVELEVGAGTTRR